MSDDGRPSEGLDPNLERRLDAVARRQRAEAERQAAELAVRTRSLADVAWGAVQAGRHVTVKTGTSEHTGLAIYARGDLLSLGSAHGTTEVNIDALDGLIVASEPAGPGRSIPREAESFDARLALIALHHEAVELTVRHSGLQIEGAVVGAARDHVVMRTAHGEMFMPVRSIAWVLRRLRDS